MIVILCCDGDPYWREYLSNGLTAYRPVVVASAEEMLAKGKAIIEMTEEDMWKAVEKHFRDGVDYTTIHVGVTKEVVEKMKRTKRKSLQRNKPHSFFFSTIHDFLNVLSKAFRKFP